MVDLACTPFAHHVERIHREFATQRAIYDFPAGKWFVPDARGPDLSVRFHGQNAANASGPAAGPHGQMAQNIVLSYLAGGRIIELKTVQINDRLTIPRPCIDATNVGYNVEWSQELRLAESLHEYVAGSMLVHMIRCGDFFCDPTSGNDVDMSGPLGDIIYDMSVGYDLKGIQSPPVRRFIETMLDATPIVSALRDQIPRDYASLRDLDYPTRLSSSITLSTFHGCPADEIERICEHLIREHRVNVIVKMNPPMLGKDRLEHFLCDVLGYRDIRVHQPAYTQGLQFDESIEIIRRLDALAKSYGLRVGAKFSNTLEVQNHRDFFTPDNQVMYMSGPPLYVITMALTARFRETIGPDCPISFSAGIDQKNFRDVIACGIVPVTTCTDLLRPGGYARLPRYMHNLAADMTAHNAADIDQYVLTRCNQYDDLKARLAKRGDAGDAIHAGWLNTPRIAADAAANPRYHAKSNNAVPRRIGSHLVIFDCITCDKCIPVCPNDANFTYPLPRQRFDYTDYRIEPDGTITACPDVRTFTTEQARQIANFADYCNECGNCDTFCPEYGGPFIEKPTFFGSAEQYHRHPSHDGFHVARQGGAAIIQGRIKTREYLLRSETSSRKPASASNRSIFNDGTIELALDEHHHPIRASWLQPAASPHVVDMNVYHTLRLLLAGVLDPSHINPVNAHPADDPA